MRKWTQVRWNQLKVLTWTTMSSVTVELAAAQPSIFRSQILSYLRLASTVPISSCSCFRSKSSTQKVTLRRATIQWMIYAILSHSVTSLHRQGFCARNTKLCPTLWTQRCVLRLLTHFASTLKLEGITFHNL